MNEVWLGRYRHWVYGIGFGWQIGTGLATYVMTSAVYLMIALGAVAGDPLAALAIGTAFGLIRGLAVLLGRKLTTPAALRDFHARLESLAASSLFVAALAQVLVLGVALGTVTVPAAGVAVATVGGLLTALRFHAPSSLLTEPRP